MLAEETAKTYSEDCEDRFLCCNELEEDGTVVDDDLNIVISLYFSISLTLFSPFFILYPVVALTFFFQFY